VRAACSEPTAVGQVGLRAAVLATVNWWMADGGLCGCLQQAHSSRQVGYWFCFSLRKRQGTARSVGRHSCLGGSLCEFRSIQMDMLWVQLVQHS
jgi:hypothetical protein